MLPIGREASHAKPREMKEIILSFDTLIVGLFIEREVRDLACRFLKRKSHQNGRRFDIYF